MNIKGALLLSFLFAAHTAAMVVKRRDLVGVVGGLLDPTGHDLTTMPVASISKPGHSFPTMLSETAKGRISTDSHNAESPAATSTTGSLSGTITDDKASISLTSTTPSWPTATSEPTAQIGYAQGASHMTPGEATEWKVIGITVLCITVVGALMLAAFFSDTWIQLVKDVCFGGNMKRKKRGDEELVPDWQRRSWEFKLADEEGHRYPTVSVSLQSLAEKKQVPPLPTALAGTTTTPLIAPPPPSYLPELDPHPLEPLLRRPSCK